MDQFFVPYAESEPTNAFYPGGSAADSKVAASYLPQAEGESAIVPNVPLPYGQGLVPHIQLETQYSTLNPSGLTNNFPLKKKVPRAVRV